MFRDDYRQAVEEKGTFEFTYTKPTYDWYEDVHVSLAWDDYNSLSLERRYGGMWWIIGHKYNVTKEKWETSQIGEIRERDIPRFVEWCEFMNKYGHKVSILTEIRTIDGALNVVSEFLKIMQKNGDVKGEET